MLAREIKDAKRQALETGHPGYASPTESPPRHTDDLHKLNAVRKARPWPKLKKTRCLQSAVLFTESAAGQSSLKSRCEDDTQRINQVAPQLTQQADNTKLPTRPLK